MSETKPSSVLATGYMALDVIQAPEGTWLRAGGTAANVSAILAYFGWRSAVVGALGDDDAGPLVQDDLRRAGVDIAGLTLRAGVGTPLVLHQIKASGHRYRFGCPECGRAYRRHRPVNQTEMERVLGDGPNADVFFFDRPTAPALAMAAIHARAGGLVVYEPASAGRPEAHRRAASIANLVKFSEERLPLFRDALPQPRDEQIWIATAGAEGTRFRVGSTEWCSLAAPRVAAIDAGGAGDWMTATLLAGLVAGPRAHLSDLTTLIADAQAVAALSCLVPGARTLADVLTPKEVREEARRLVSGDSPRLTYQFRSDPPADDHCPHCRLPISEAVGQAS
jgi:fructokinase